MLLFHERNIVPGLTYPAMLKNEVTVEARIENELTLPDLDEVLDVMVNHSSASTIINLSNCSTRFHSFFSNARPLAQQCLRQLLSYADLGEYEDAKCMWKLFPELLTCRGIVFHPNQTYVEGQKPIAISLHKNPGRYKYVGPNGEGVTAWQIALMNEEYEHAEEMGKRMTEEEKKKQFFAIFPDAKIIKHNWDLEYAKKLLHAVFDALIDDTVIDENDLSKMSEATQRALYALYEYVKPQSAHKTGLVCDPNFYLAALELYDNCYSKLQTYKRCSFWNIKVEEWLAACLGTGYLRNHAQGIGNPVRHSDCVLANGSSYFAFRRRANSIPGEHFFVARRGECGRPPEGRGAPPWLERGRIFQNLCQAKTKSGAEFTRCYASGGRLPACLIL